MNQGSNKSDTSVHFGVTPVFNTESKRSVFSHLSILYILLSIIFQSGSIVFGKYASLTIQSITIKNLLLSPYYMLTLGCLFLQALTWQQALRHYPLAWSYMFMSAVYPILMLASYFIFHEQVTLGNLIGTVIILIGVINLLKGRS